MLRRKAYDALMEWKGRPHKPLLVKGQRQVGKTFIIEAFAKKNYAYFVNIDFRSDKDARKVFSGNLDVGSMIWGLEILYPDAVFEPGSTLILFDEIQDSLPKLNFDVNSAHLFEFPRFRHSSRWHFVRNSRILSVDEVIRIEFEDFDHPHEQFLMFRRTVEILPVALAHQVHRIDLARYSLHSQIHAVLLQDMGYDIRYHRSKGYHEHHRILPRRPVDVHPVDPHAVLHEPESML